MALIRANNKTIQNVTTLPTGVTEYNLGAGDLPSGSVLQVVQGTLQVTDTATSSTNYVDTGLSATITPSSTANKILILIHCHLQVPSGSSAPIAIYRNAASIVQHLISLSDPTADGQPAAANWLDSPSSSSALTYDIYFRTENSSYQAKFGNASSGGNAYNTVTLMEIAG